MGYATVEKVLFYTPSDNVVINNPDEEITTSGSYTKLKEITIVYRIATASQFRFIVEGNADAGSTGYAYVDYEGTQICDAMDFPAGGYADDTKDQNVAVTFAPGGRFSLYVRNNNTPNRTYVRNWRICGSGSEFNNTL